MHTISWQRRWERASAARILVWAASALLFAGLLLTAPPKAVAQQFTTRHYQPSEELANLTVACLVQDRAGFIWICTDDGLFRHDGVGFERFGNSAGLDSATIHGAVEDISGALWISTPRDLYRRDQQGFRAIRPEGRSLAPTAGMQLAPLASGELLVIDAGQLLELRVAAADGVWHSRPFFTSEQLDATPALEHLKSLYVDRSGRIWLGCGAAICRIERGRVEIFDATLGTPEDVWRSWLLDRDGRLWVRGLQHVAVLDPQAVRFEIRDPPHARLIDESFEVALAEDPDGRVLTNSKIGLSRWQENDWQDLTKANGIPDGVSSLLVSRDGQVWLGLRGHGMVRWLGYGHFESWTMAQGLGDLRVRSILRSADQSVLFATRAGCYRLVNAARLAAPCQFDGLPRGEVQAMAQDGGGLWIGMVSGALYRVGAGDGRAIWVADVPSLRKLYVDSSSRLWIGTEHGVDVLETNATHVELMPLPAPGGAVTDITEDQQGAIWLATQGGLLRWSAGRWTILGIEGESAHAGFASLAADRGGWLWAGGAAHGVLHLHVAGDRADEVHWVPEFKSAHAAATFTRIDSRGWVWVGTDAGVRVFDGRVWRRLDTEDGLIWNDTAENGFLADADGSVWIGTRAGSTHIKHPEALMQSTPIDLRITRSKLGAQELDADSLRRSWEPDMTLNLHLAQFSFGNVGQSHLRARLIGLGDAWFDTVSHDIHFPALEPGRYTFEAMAVDPDHQRTSALTHLSFEILPPWWRTTWIQLTAAAALLVVLGGVWRRRNRKRGAHQRELERQKKEHEALVVRATRDALTGLWNRSSILEILAREVESARQRATTLAVAIIDIDHFKRINDTRGHLAGDEVLRTLGAKLIKRVRAADALGRYGGEEFLLVVPGAPKQAPFLPLERLQRAVAEIRFTYAGEDIKVTASFGVAWLTGETDTAELLLSRADAALYSAKHAGRNRVEYAATG
jgi:diguanylate cyclase (GGDEF)-like protein